MREILGAMAMAGIVAFAFSISRGDPASSAPATPDDRLMPVPGDETPRTDRFVLTDPGPEVGHWKYEHLTAQEKAIVDRGRTRSNADAIHRAYDAAVREENDRATATAAANELQASELEAIGVIQ